MEVDVIYSTLDPVGVAASRVLVEYLRARPQRCEYARECFAHERGLLAGYDSELVGIEFLDVSPSTEPRPIIAVSRHASQSCRSTLSIHHPGNPTSAAAGGKPYTLAYSHPSLAKTLLVEYRRSMTEIGLESEYELTLEATHHGPTETRKPIVFIEVGSCEKQWRDPKAILALAQTVYRVVEFLETPLSCTPVAAFGETHYPKRFTKAMLETELCFGHIISKHQIAGGLPGSVIEQALLKAYPEPSRRAVVEKASVKKESLLMISEIATRLGIPVDYW